MQRLAKFKLAVLCVSSAVLTNVSTTTGHEGDPEAERALSSAYIGQRLGVGSPDAAEAIGAIVARAAEVKNEAGQWLLPPGTTLDDVEWVGNVLEIHVTVPPASDRLETGPTDWYLSPIDVETISRAVGSPFMNDPAFGGTRVRVRVGQDQPYGTLEQFLLHKAAATPAEEAIPSEKPAPLERSGDEGSEGGTVTGGPTVQAARQPIGALTGVTVFASAGHGWTADNVEDGDPTDFMWYLQRPVLLGMCEDYGNIDMLNYFVAYAFNAGATVVPFRPVGWQPIEIVLDNDDPGVTYEGTWNDGSSSKYYENGVTNSGIVYKWTSAAATETATARYTPDVTVTDFYPVYCFTIAGDNRTLQSYRISHSGGVTEVTIDHRLVGNGWIWLGNYYLEVGGDNYIEITNESTETGAIIADAIRWGGGWGDIVRPGPGSVSGYPRDEEAQRYWAEGELGNNAVGFDPYIWDVDGYDDGSDNVRTGAKWAREMNQEPAGGVLVDRWKRIHLEFHTNAAGCPGGPPCGARGQLCLITDLGATTYQVEYALTLSNEVDADMLIMDGEFEHDWFDRFSPTLTGSYGAICTPANGDEFDATIVELAFHDNEEDTELLRDCRVRAAMARSCVQGIIRFLHSLPNSEVPLAFAPDTPRYVRARDLGNGDILLSWEPPLSDEARGDPASGYVVYQSANGYGFGNPIIVGEETAVTISDVPLGETLCLRVAATNNGGESMPSEVLAVRRRSNPDDARILIVNGFDRLRRQINAIQTFTQPPPYAGDSIERQIWWKSNSFDYVMQHAEALAANDYGFDSCSNDAVIDSYVQLRDYKVVVWILGTESSEDATFNSNEQNKVTDFLLDGGGLFVTGSEIAYDLIDQGHGVSFLQDTLRVGYVADDAQTFEVTGTAGSILEGVGTFDFDPAYGAPYEVRSPDVLMPGAEAQECLSYVGGIGGVAGVQYAGVIHHVVTFGFPFETITSVTVRAEIMGPVIEFLALSPGPPPFDYNRDGDVDFQDFTTFLWCFQGPEIYYPAGHTCVDVLGEEDLDIDLADFSVLQRHFTGTGQP